MKTTNPSRRGNAVGNVLIATLATAMVIGTMLAGYLEMVGNQNRSIARSQAWNAVLPISEAGIEEALTQLYHVQSTNLACNGWNQSGAVFAKSHTNILGGRYSVTISNDVPPTIYSTGFYPAPLTGGELARTVKVTTKGGFLFTRALVAKGDINVGNGNVDSFDSGGTNSFSRAGTILSSGGDSTSLGGNITLGANGVINGHASVGAKGTISGGSIGPIGSTGYAPSYLNYNASGTIPDVPMPAAATNGTTLNLSVAYVFLFSGSYQCSGVSGTIIVTNGAQVTLYCNGPFGGTVTIATNSSLTVYMAGSSVSLSGKGVINPGACENFILYGLPSLTSITISGNGNFSGCIYAPEASLTLNGAGSGGFLAGAAVVNSATFNGNNSNFNYDESLGRMGPRAAYVVASWCEL